jgi:hypothetical protein
MIDPGGIPAPPPPINPELKFQTAPEFLAVFNELNVIQDQLTNASSSFEILKSC